MKNFLIALVALALVPAAVEAGGGGGGKANAKIKVTNNGTDVLLVILDKTDAQIGAFADLDAFLAAGGKAIDAGGNATFTGLKAGNHGVAAAYTDGAFFGAISRVVIHSKSGRTDNVSATGDSFAAPNLTVK